MDHKTRAPYWKSNKRYCNLSIYKSRSVRQYDIDILLWKNESDIFRFVFVLWLSWRIIPLGTLSSLPVVSLSLPVFFVKESLVSTLIKVSLKIIVLSRNYLDHGFFTHSCFLKLTVLFLRGDKTRSDEYERETLWFNVSIETYFTGSVRFLLVFFI